MLKKLTSILVSAIWPKKEMDQKHTKCKVRSQTRKVGATMVKMISRMKE